MEAPQSFAPLAARLAAHADEIRPVDGAEVSWANFMALFFRAILYGLIALCEALDARAATDTREFLAQPPRGAEAGAVPAVRSATQALLGGRRPSRLALVPSVQTRSTGPAEALSGDAGVTRLYPALAWTRHPDPIRAVAGPLLWNFRETSGFSTELKHAYFVTLT